MRLLTKLSAATAIVSLSFGACSGDPLKRITVKMKLQQGAVGQGDRASLHFQKGAVDCSLNFYSGQSIKYVESFGSALVPAVFSVSYANSGKPTGATLLRVGEWDASKFQPNETLLATAEGVEVGKSGETKTFRVDSPASCFEAVPGTKDLRFSSGLTLFLLLLTVNLGLLAAAFLHSGEGPCSEHSSRRTLLGTVAVALACGSQILFLVYAAAGRFAWVRFYPGNPIQIYAILVGVILSCVALGTALFGIGLKRIAGALVAITTAGLWVLAAIASVAV